MAFPAARAADADVVTAGAIATADVVIAGAIATVVFKNCYFHICSDATIKSITKRKKAARTSGFAA